MLVKIGILYKKVPAETFNGPDKESFITVFYESQKKRFMMLPYRCDAVLEDNKSLAEILIKQSNIDEKKFSGYEFFIDQRTYELFRCYEGLVDGGS